MPDARAARIREGMELARERNGTPTRGRPCPRCSTVIESLAVETSSPTVKRLEAFPCRHQWLWYPRSSDVTGQFESPDSPGGDNPESPPNATKADADA